MTKAYVPLAAGRFYAHRVRVDGHWLTVIKGPNGATYGSIAGRQLPGSTRKRPQTDGTIFAAHATTWFLPAGYHLRGTAYPIVDLTGAVSGHLEVQGPRTRLIHLPGDTFVWERHSMSPAYRIEGGYLAARRTVHQMVPGFSNRPFNGTIGPRIADRPDGALALLLAAWFTATAIERKVLAAQSDVLR